MTHSSNGASNLAKGPNGKDLRILTVLIVEWPKLLGNSNFVASPLQRAGEVFTFRSPYDIAIIPRLLRR